MTRNDILSIAFIFIGIRSIASAIYNSMYIIVSASQDVAAWQSPINSFIYMLNPVFSCIWHLIFGFLLIKYAKKIISANKYSDEPIELFSIESEKPLFNASVIIIGITYFISSVPGFVQAFSQRFIASDTSDEIRVPLAAWVKWHEIIGPLALLVFTLILVLANKKFTETVFRQRKNGDSHLI